MTLPANYKEIKLSKAAARLLRRAGDIDVFPLVYHIHYEGTPYFVKTDGIRMMAVSAERFNEADGGFKFEGKRKLVRVESPESEDAAKIAKHFAKFFAGATERVTLLSATVEFETGSPCLFGIPHSEPVFMFRREGSELAAADSHQTVTHCMNYEALKIASRWWMYCVSIPAGECAEGVNAPWRFEDGAGEFVMLAMPSWRADWETPGEREIEDEPEKENEQCHA